MYLFSWISDSLIIIAISKMENSNFEYGMRPLILASQFWCTAPLRKDKGISGLKGQLLSIGYYFWGMLISVCTTISVYYQHIEFDTGMSFLTKILYMGEYFFNIFNLLLIFFGTQFYRKRFFHICLRLNQFERKLNRFNVNTDFSYIRKLVIRSLIVYGIFFFCVFVVDILYNRVHVPSFFRSSTVYIIPNLISVLGLSIYGLLLFSVKFLIDLINRALVIRNNSTNFIENLQAPFIFFKEIHIDSRERRGLTSKLVDDLRIIYGELCDLSKDINSMYGILIISTVVASFLVLNIQFYAFYKTSEGYTQEDIALMFYTALWIVLYTGKIFIILRSNESLINAVSNFVSSL